MRRSPRRRQLLATAAWFAASFSGSGAWAGNIPAIGAGQASVASPNSSLTVIRQTSERAVYNWQSLSLAAGNTLQFVEPDSAAVALNRVLGGGASAINGSLLANGQVWIINPAGVIFGHGAAVNVGGLIATTTDIRDQDFLAGNYAFSMPTGTAAAAVVNQGMINVADGGAAVLAARQVANQGVIQATLGRVVLAGANAFTVDFQGDKLLSFEITAPVGAAPADGGALVGNSGLINAAGGSVLLTARAARSVIDNVINMSGTVEATTAHEENREIVLDAGPGGTANVSGTLDASGKAAGATGGTVEVLGDHVALAATARIDASGDAGGGTVLIGGNLHGAGPLANALTTAIAQGSTINASAVTSGNGGTVAVWSNLATSFNGAITVEGGATGGNGGQVETSSAGNLTIATGIVDALAPKGAVGNWLLDPANITIQTGVGGQTSLTANNSTFGGDTGLTDTIAPTALESATADVTLQATGSINVVSPVTMIVNGVGVTMEAGGSITVTQPITTNGGLISLQANSNAGNSATGGGGINLSAPLSTTGNGQTGGAITLAVFGGTGTVQLGGNLTTELGAISIVAPMVLTANATIDTTNNFVSHQAAVGAAVVFDGTINDNASDTHALTVISGDNTLTFNGAVGNILPIGQLVLSGGTNIAVNAPMTLVDFTNFVSNVLVTVNATITGSGGASLFFETGDSDSNGVNSTSANVVFGAGGHVNFASAAGQVFLGYHPASYAAPTNFASDITVGSGGLNIFFNVTDAADLQNVATNLAANYELSGNIDASTIPNFTPIGTSSTPYRGIFNGDGSVINHLTINSSAQYVGLFGAVGSGGVVENLGLTNATVTPGFFTGGSVDGTLVGLLNGGTVSNSYSTGTLNDSANASTGGFVGGLIGDATGTVVQTYSTVAVTGSGGFIGGLAGINSGTISQSYAFGPVSGASGAWVGGLVGDNSSAGGIITNSYATGAVSGASAANLGALAGRNENTVSLSYATGSVGASSGNVGGLVGDNFGSGTVSGNSYWDTTTTGQSIGAGAGNAIPASLGLTTGQFQSGIPSGFSHTIWNIDVAAGNGVNSNFAYLASSLDTVSGTVYSDRGQTTLTGATVDLAAGGVIEGSVLSGAGGSYSVPVVAGAIPPGAELLTYLFSVASGNTLYDSATERNGTGPVDMAGGGQGISGVDIYGGYLHIISGAANLSSMASGLQTALGGLTGAQFLFSIGGGPSISLNAGTNLQIDASGSAFTIDQAINAAGAEVVLNAPGTGINPPATVTQTQPITANLLGFLGTGATYTLTSGSNAVGTLAWSTGAVTFTDGTALAIGGPLTGSSYVTTTGGVTLTAPALFLDGDITTMGGAVTFNGPMVLRTDNEIDTTSGGAVPTGATVTFAGTVDGFSTFGQSLTIAAGSGGDVDFEQRVGQDLAAPTNIGIPLGDVTINSANNVNMTMPFGANGDGFSAYSLTVANTQTLTANSYINTALGGVTIATTGAVSIGAGIPLNTLGLTITAQNPNGIDTQGEDATSATGAPTSGGAVAITASSITIPAGIDTFGGSNRFAGASSNGGNGGTVSLNAVGGVTIGSSSGGPDLYGIGASGGDSNGAEGGAGGAVTITGTNLLLASIDTNGGNSSVFTGGAAAGNIALVATATSGVAVTLWGSANSASGAGVSLVALGGTVSDTNVTTAFAISNGPITGHAGNITIGSTMLGAPLLGTSFIQLLTNTAAAQGGGSTVMILAGGGIGIGGTITIGGPIEAATANVESLYLDASNGSATLAGSVGDVTPLSTFFLGLSPIGFQPGNILTPTLQSGSTGGAIVLRGSVTAVTQILDTRSNGTLTLDANLTTPGGLISLGAPIVLGASITIDTTDGNTVPTGADITIGNTLGGASFETESLTLAAGGAGSVLLQGDVGFAAGTRPATLTIASADSVTANGADGIFAHDFTDTNLGNLTVLGIIDTDGVSSVSPQAYNNAGSISITAGGAVMVGAGLTAPNSSGSYVTSLYSGGANAGVNGNPFGLSVGNTTGNAGAITVNAASIDLFNSASARGGTSQVAAVNGGNAAPITLTASGAIVLGGDRGVSLQAYGGFSLAPTGAGNGGNGAAITVTGQSIIVDRVESLGGDSTNAGATGGNAGAISLQATGGNVTVYGVGNALSDASVNARGGVAGVTSPGPFDLFDTTTGGTQTGSGGNITITVPNGDSLVLATRGAGVGADPGSTVAITATGAGAAPPGTSGLITITGDIDATTANVESLNVRTKGGVIVTGAVGSAVPLKTITLINSNSAENGGTATFDGAVTADTAFTDSQAAGSLTIQGLLTTPSFTPPSGTASITLSGGATVAGGIDFTNTGPVSLAGSFQSGAIFADANAPITLTGPTTVTTTSTGDIDIFGTIDGAQPLTLDASGVLTLSGPVGGLVPLGPVTLSGSTVELNANITTAEGAIGVTGPTVLNGGSVTLDTTANGTLAAGANVSFSSTIDAVSGEGLTVTAGTPTGATGTAIFGGAIGSSFPLGPLTVTAAEIELGGNVSTTLSTGTVTLTGPVVLRTNVAISTATGTVSISGINDGATEVNSLSAAAPDAFSIFTSGGAISINGGTLGGIAPLGAVTFSGPVTLNSSIITAAGAVTFNDTVVLGNSVGIDTTATGTISAGANISFASTIAGAAFEAQNLTLTAGAGNILFQGNVGGGGLRLETLDIASAGNVTSTAANGIFAETFTATSQGNLTVAGEITTNGVSSNVTSPAVNGGAITITAGGAVSIGSGLALPNAVTGGYQASLDSGGAAAGSSGNTLNLGIGTVVGNAGSIDVSAGSIDLFNSARAGGGSTDEAGLNGGNAAPITLHATGAIVLGGNRGATLNAIGGTSIAGATAGTGGNGAAITVTGQSIVVDRVVSSGGDTTNAAATGGAGGAISLTATGGGITLYGTSGPPQVTLLSQSGRDGATAVTANISQGLTVAGTGTLGNTGGNITLTVPGGQTITLATETAGNEPGSIVVISAAGGGVAPGLSGVITVNGNIDATTANVESLELATKGGVTVTGAIGSAVPLNTLTVETALASTVGGSAIFDGAVTLDTALVDTQTSGTLTIDGLLTVPTLAMTAGTVALTLDGGAVISSEFNTSGLPLTLAGIFTFTSSFAGGGTINEPITLSGPTTIDLSAPNTPITVTQPINGTGAGGQALTLETGTAAVTVAAALGGTVPLGAITIDGGSALLSSAMTTAGGAITINAPTTLQGNVALASAGGTITFASTVAGAAFEAQNLTLTAGASGNILFQGNVGGGGLRLEAIDIASADNVTSTAASGIFAETFTATSQGNFTVAGQITTNGVSSNVTSPAVNGGAITITAGGAVSIGSGLALPNAVTGTYVTSLFSPGADAGSNGNTLGLGVGTVVGNAASISVTAGSIDLFNGATAGGGRTDETGLSGGNAAPITLHATGAIVVGGNRGVSLTAVGGDSIAATGAGNGGNGAAITVTGQSIVVDRVVSPGGDTTNATATGGTGGAIALTATGGGITLYGTGGAPAVTVLSRSGKDGATAVTANVSQGLTVSGTGTLDNTGGNITLTVPSGQTVRLATETAGNEAGSDVVIGAPGGGATAPGESGVTTINGNIDATTANVESLELATKGGVTVTGAVGGAVPLNTLMLDTNYGSTVGGSAIFEGAVTLDTALIDTRTSGSVVFDGVLSVPTITRAAGTTTLILNGGATVSGPLDFGTAPVTLQGTYTSTGTATNSVITAPVTLAGATTFNTNNSAISVVSIDDSSAGAEPLTINAGSGTVTLTSLLGGTVPLGAVTVTGGNIVLGSTITTSGAPVVLNGSTTVSGTASITTAAGGHSAGIMLAGTVSGGALTLNAGVDGGISVTGAATLASLTVSESGGASFAGAVDAPTVTIANTNGLVAFPGGLTTPNLVTAAQPYALSISGPSTLLNQTTFLNTGGVTLAGVGGPVVFNNGVTSTAGVTTLSGTIVVNGQPANFGTTTLAGATTVDPAAGAGIFFSGQITGGANPLTLNAGGGTLALSGLDDSVDPTLIGNPLLLQSGGYALGSGPYTFGSVTLSGTLILGQSTNFGPTILATSSTVDSSLVNGAIDFQNTVTGSNPLTGAVPLLLTISAGTGLVTVVGPLTGVDVVQIFPTNGFTPSQQNAIDSSINENNTTTTSDNGTGNPTGTGTGTDTGTGSDNGGNPSSSPPLEGSTNVPASTPDEVTIDETALLSAISPGGSGGSSNGTTPVGPLEFQTLESTAGQASAGQSGAGQSTSGGPTDTTATDQPGQDSDSVTNAIGNSFAQPGQPHGKGSQQGNKTTYINGALVVTPVGGQGNGAGPQAVTPASQEQLSDGNGAFYP